MKCTKTWYYNIKTVGIFPKKAFQIWLSLQHETNYTIIKQVNLNAKITFYRKCIVGVIVAQL